jgi:hypothetical protein
MDFQSETGMTAPVKTAPKKSRRTKKHSPETAEFETLLQRRHELTVLAHQAQDKLDELKAQIAQAELVAEGAWDQAIDMNAVIREKLTDLRDSGVNDRTIYDLIDRYNAL